MSGHTGFRLVGEVDAPDEAAQVASQTAPNSAERHTALLMLSLRALSQRALTAASTLFTGIAVGSAWLLWQSVLPNPSNAQLVGLGMYAGFICAIEILRRRK